WPINRRRIGYDGCPKATGRMAGPRQPGVPRRQRTPAVSSEGIMAAEDVIETDEEELDLASLDDDELVEQMHDDLYDGLREEIVEGTQILLDRGWAPDKVLADALVEGMRIVGIDFRDG